MNVFEIIMRKIKTIGAIALASIVIGAIGTVAEWSYMNISEGEDNWLAFIFFASILSVLFFMVFITWYAKNTKNKDK
jgi:hypothetical protein